MNEATCLLLLPTGDSHSHPCHPCAVRPCSPLARIFIVRSRRMEAGGGRRECRRGMIYLADKSIPPPPACAISVLLLLSLRAGRPFSLLRSLHDGGGRFWWKRCLFPAPQSDINQQNSETHAELLLPSSCRRRRRRCPTALLRQLTHVRGVSCRIPLRAARDSARRPSCVRPLVRSVRSLRASLDANCARPSGRFFKSFGVAAATSNSRRRR